MIDMMPTVQIVLEEAGYAVWLVVADDSTAVCFEDEAVMGFVCMFDDPEQLLSRWSSIESTLLVRHAARFRTAEQKAWNVYSIFLCAKAGTEEQTREITSIDENLERTRKIAACGLVGKDDVVTALLPVLPLQYRPVLERENVTERLKRRISAIAPTAVDVALDENVPASDVLPMLGAQP
jgi:hypothetical protein